MSTDANETPNTQLALEFKSSTFSVPVLVLLTEDLILFKQQLLNKTKQAPDFFKNSPLVLDLQPLNKLGYDIKIVEVVGIIRQAGLLIVGLRGGSLIQNEQALELHIPIYSSLSEGAITAEDKKQKKAAPSSKSDEEIKVDVRATTLITHPIRSGQRIYAEGDLIIMAQVSAGAEIIAEGNIHVYNTLRGRALAGVQGNIDARIFCFDLQAELISIAGNYKVSEDLDKSVRNKPVQIYLQNQSLIIKDIVQHH